MKRQGSLDGGRYHALMDAVSRHAVTVTGPKSGVPLLFVHGFGCNKAMWEPVASEFSDRRCVLMDLVGFGDSDSRAFDRSRYMRLEGHAEDVIELIEELDCGPVAFIGHSVASMIGVLVAKHEPDLVDRLVLVGPSPRYIDSGPYRGGFSQETINDLLLSLEQDFVAWSEAMAPVIAGKPDRPEYGRQLADSFCRSHPPAAELFARVTFLSDNRADLAHVSVPTLVLQCRHDAIAPDFVGEFVHEQIPDSELVVLEATGHCPHLTSPEETAEAIRRFVT